MNGSRRPNYVQETFKLRFMAEEAKVIGTILAIPVVIIGGVLNMIDPSHHLVDVYGAVLGILGLIAFAIVAYKVLRFVLRLIFSRHRAEMIPPEYKFRFFDHAQARARPYRRQRCEPTFDEPFIRR